MTESEVFHVRTNYKMGTLETFRKQPQDARGRIWITPKEFERLGLLRERYGQKPPLSVSTRITAEDRIRVQKSYKPRVR